MTAVRDRERAPYTGSIDYRSIIEGGARCRPTPPFARRRDADRRHHVDVAADGVATTTHTLTTPATSSVAIDALDPDRNVAAPSIAAPGSPRRWRLVDIHRSRRHSTHVSAVAIARPAAASRQARSSRNRAGQSLPLGGHGATWRLLPALPRAPPAPAPGRSAPTRDPPHSLDHGRTRRIPT